MSTVAECVKTENVTEMIIGACYKVMNELGIGFSETVYKNSIALLLRQMMLEVSIELPLEVYFQSHLVGSFKADLMVAKNVVVELKCCKTLLPEHQAQLINYLKASRIKLGLLINMGNAKVEVKRVYNSDYFDDTL